MSEDDPALDQFLKTLMSTMSAYTEGVKAISLVSESGLPISTVVREGDEFTKTLL